MQNIILINIYRENIFLLNDDRNLNPAEIHDYIILLYVLQFKK